MPESQQPVHPPSAVPATAPGTRPPGPRGRPPRPRGAKSLANLAEQMADTLSQSHVPTAEETELGQLAGELIEALHREERPPPPPPAIGSRRRLWRPKHGRRWPPRPPGRLLDALANLGI